MKRSHFPLWLYALLIFAGGTAVGALGHRLYSSTTVNATAATSKKPDEWRQSFCAQMKSRVKLDAEQMTKLDAVLDESKILFNEVRAKYRPEMKAIYDAQVAKIKTMLTPAQLPEYERILEEQQREREKK